MSKKFLLINPFGVGDVLFTSPVVKAIKEVYPQSFIGYWCNQRTAELFKCSPFIDKVYDFSRGDLKKIFARSKLEGIKRALRLWLALRRERYDVCLDFSLDHRYGLVSKLCGINTRIGFDYKHRGRFLTHKIGIEGYSARHIVDYYLELLKFISINPVKKDLNLFICGDARNKINELFSKLGISDSDLIISIAPGAGASWGKDAALKHWPAQCFAEVANRLARDFRAKVLLLGDPSERPIAEAILKQTHNKIIDLVGKSGLQDLAAILEKSCLLITNDGGPMHLAVALGIKTVTIFGPVDDKVYGPYPAGNPRHIVIKKNLSCRPCYKKFRMPQCLHNKECLFLISPEEVLEQVRRQL